MINLMNPDKLLEHAELIIASLSRFTDEAPTASILKSSLKGTSLFFHNANQRHSGDFRGRSQVGSN